MLAPPPPPLLLPPHSYLLGQLGAGRGAHELRVGEDVRLRFRVSPRHYWYATRIHGTFSLETRIAAADFDLSSSLGIAVCESLRFHTEKASSFWILHWYDPRPDFRIVGTLSRPALALDLRSGCAYVRPQTAAGEIHFGGNLASPRLRFTLQPDSGVRVLRRPLRGPVGPAGGLLRLTVPRGPVHAASVLSIPYRVRRASRVDISSVGGPIRVAVGGRTLNVRGMHRGYGRFVASAGGDHVLVVVRIAA